MMDRGWIGAVVVGLLLAGCVSTGGGPKTTETPEGATMTTDKDLEVMVFDGGFGKDFYETAAQEYAEEAGVNPTVIADARIDDMIRPRFLNGDPPDLAFPGWRFDHWRAVEDGQVMPLDKALEGKAWNSEAVWKDTFEPSLLKLGQRDGKQYVMPYFYSVLGWWYDPVLFKENGWTPPRTYNELLVLCQKIKAAGIAPITYQGKYPDYMIAGMLIPWTISAGGMDQFTKMQNLEPGAWNSPAVIKAASMIAELRAMEYFQRGATAMDHTEAQTQFVTGKAAMVPCGTWLYSEMSSSMPEGTQMEFMMPPVLGDGSGDPTAVMIKIEPWFVPSEGRNQEHAVGLYKYMTSPEKAKQFVEQKGTFVAVKGIEDAKIPVHLEGASKHFTASKAVYAQQWRDWYRPFYEEVEKAVTRLLNGELTPEQFAEHCEAEAEKIRNDKRIPKFTAE